MADTLAGHDTATGASIPHPEDDGALWDRIKLGPHVLPGAWVVSGAIERRVDVKRSKNKDGARFKDQGYEPASLTLTGETIGASDFNAMVKIMKVLTPRNRGVSLEPIAAEHPAFTILGITNVLVLKVFAPVLDGGKVRFTISVTEWVPKPKQKKEPKNIVLGSAQFNANSLIGGGAFVQAAARAITPATDTPTYFAGVIEE